MRSNLGRIRIIGGQWRSRIISFPVYTDLRPTPDRVRETLFNWLGQDLTGLSCLDLFAGSGALGFEAASRGAKHVVMVESSGSALHALSDNKIKLNAEQVELVRMDASIYLVTDKQKFDIVFLDPPYRMKLLPEILPLLPPHMSEDGLVYLETGRSDDLDQILQHWKIWRKSKAGKVNCYLLEMKQEPDDCG
ncbi:MAG: 16S rRNA (guanine(966)-N(2))-methyltransferase RsmD [Nitrosomonas sp.]|nr:16S rRNA (guanine(966)-N(2))-methyltransferase RsmD [Nitrosomonas sp.]